MTAHGEAQPLLRLTRETLGALLVTCPDIDTLDVTYQPQRLQLQARLLTGADVKAAAAIITS